MAAVTTVHFASEPAHSWTTGRARILDRYYPHFAIKPIGVSVMSPSATAISDLPEPLQEVARSSGDEVRAQADNNDEAARDARRSKTEAAARAMDSGCDFAQLAEAERLGRSEAIESLRGDLLKRVERAAKRRSETDREYRESIRRAVGVGLPHRDVGHAAGVSHATVRAIVERTVQASAVDGSPIYETSDDEAAGGENSPQG